MSKRLLLSLLLISQLITTPSAAQASAVVLEQSADVLKVPIYFIVGHGINFFGNAWGKAIAKQLGALGGDIPRRTWKINQKHLVNAMGKYAVAGIPERIETRATMPSEDVYQYLLDNSLSNQDKTRGWQYITHHLGNGNTEVVSYEFTGETTPVFFIGWDADQQHRVMLNFVQLDPHIFDTKTWQGKAFSSGTKMLTLYDVLEFIVHGTRKWNGIVQDGLSSAQISVKPENPIWPTPDFGTSNCTTKHNRIDVHEMVSRSFDVITSIPQSVLHDIPKNTFTGDFDIAVSTWTHFASAYFMQLVAFAVSDVAAHVFIMGLGAVDPSVQHGLETFFAKSYPFNVIFFTTFSFPFVGYLWHHVNDALHLTLEQFGLYDHRAEDVYHNAYGAGDKGPLGMTGLRMIWGTLGTLPVLNKILPAIDPLNTLVSTLPLAQQQAYLNALHGNPNALSADRRLATLVNKVLNAEQKAAFDGLKLAAHTPVTDRINALANQLGTDGSNPVYQQAIASKKLFQTIGRYLLATAFIGYVGYLWREELHSGCKIYLPSICPPTDETTIANAHSTPDWMPLFIVSFFSANTQPSTAAPASKSPIEETITLDTTEQSTGWGFGTTDDATKPPRDEATAPSVVDTNVA